jgi:protein TonB
VTQRISLPSTFAVSALLHLLVLLFVANRVIAPANITSPLPLPVTLLEGKFETALPTPPAEKSRTAEPVKPPPAKSPPQETKRESAQPTPPPTATAREETVRPAEMKSPVSAISQPSPGPARPERGGSETGSGVLGTKGEIGLLPVPGSATGGGGTAVTGLGRGSGAPGLPGQGQPLSLNREARPLHAVRAVYPAMALRAGLESDVTLRIEIDPQGGVIKAEIIKSGGAGFDDEALKAIAQARFEPAQRDGQSVAAEFTYIYRFRLQR